MKKDTLIIHAQHSAAIKSLSMDDRGLLLTVMMQYQFEDIDPRDLPAHMAIAWHFVKAFIDEMNERYAAVSEVRSISGQKGGAPRGNRNAVKTNKTTISLKNKQNNLNDKDYEYDNE